VKTARILELGLWLLILCLVALRRHDTAVVDLLNLFVAMTASTSSAVQRTSVSTCGGRSMTSTSSRQLGAIAAITGRASKVGLF